MKTKYISVGKPIKILSFESNNAPMGWQKLTLIKEKIRKDKKYRVLFSKREIAKIRGTL